MSEDKYKAAQQPVEQATERIDVIEKKTEEIKETTGASAKKPPLVEFEVKAELSGDPKKPKVRDKEAALADLKKHVGELDMFATAALEGVTDGLYMSYEDTGELPAKDALVDGLKSVGHEAVAEKVVTMKYDPFVVSSKRKKIVMGAVAAAVVLALAGGGAWMAFGQQPVEQAPAPEPAKVEQKAVEEKKDEASAVKLTVKAEGADDAATKAKIVVKDKDGKAVVAEKEVAANKAIDLGKLDKGDYELIVTTAPVLKDGSTYKLPEKATKIVVKGDGKAVTVEIKLEKIDVKDMSADEAAAAAKALEAAGDKDAAATVIANQQAVASGGNAGSSGNTSSGGGESYAPPAGGGGNDYTPPSPTPTPTPDPAPTPTPDPEPAPTEHYLCSVCGELTADEYPMHQGTAGCRGNVSIQWY
ncbi:hypothetical protein [Eggerthella sp. YY7918]|uniref:hypothetical protein n=1 Tax=Eggerthella sp. (strain YY7918) TaxID=502558 RepID=UPI000217129A|nr:hypothetical protein [Eggerthella sp. YY7918]BAK45830.1 hypothetical protein EGYY_28530 [Eggerthella sp. YY7918]